MSHYSGTWLDGANGYTLTFNYDFFTGATTAFASWDLDAVLDWGWYMPIKIPPPPMVEYLNAHVDATFTTWSTILQITG